MLHLGANFDTIISNEIEFVCVLYLLILLEVLLKPGSLNAPLPLSLLSAVDKVELRTKPAIVFVVLVCK